jgi:hypothetical protein
MEEALTNYRIAVDKDPKFVAAYVKIGKIIEEKKF